MDLASEEFLKLASTLEAHKVRNISVDGFSGIFMASTTRLVINGTPVRFLHYNHLIQNKKATGPPRDLEDVRQLERIYNKQ